MAIQGGVELLVTPEVLNSKASEVERDVKDMRQRFDAMDTLIKKSSSYWIGEAGDMYRQNYESQVPEIERMLGVLSQHPQDLRAIAQTYTDVELKNAGIAQELPGDLL